MALVWFLRANASGITAAQEIQEAEKILDPLNIKLAQENAVEFVVRTNP